MINSRILKRELMKIVYGFFTILITSIFCVLIILGIIWLCSNVPISVFWNSMGVLFFIGACYCVGDLYKTYR